MYCEPDDVKLIIETSLTPDEIGRLIYHADKDLDTMLGSHNMSDDLKKRCSSMLTAIIIADGMPKGYTVGTARVTHGDRVKRWIRKVDELVATATGGKFGVVVSDYQKIDEETRYPS